MRTIIPAGFLAAALLGLIPWSCGAAPAAVPMPASIGSAPRPLPGRPGNVHVEGDDVWVRVPPDLPSTAVRWSLVDDRGRILHGGELPQGGAGRGDRIPLGSLGIGWYRLEFRSTGGEMVRWTTAAVLRKLRAPAPEDTPVALDAAVAWFARDDAVKQREFASLAALAGVRWTRDRLRWGELQPQKGRLVEGSTTYDTAAEAQCAENLRVLQVFHDTPAWAREETRGGGRFAPDLRDAYAFGLAAAVRFDGGVAAWEPWNEANVASFGGHTVDQMCSWQKAVWLGLKAGDPEILVGWNATAAVPTPAHTEGVLANETWPYFDTYNIHSYDWSHGYADLWEPARRAASGRPIWVTEADRGTPHQKDPPWYDQDPRLERLKAEWMAQSYAASLFAGAQRHFHFILGHYHEPSGVQFGLLRLDLTPRPAYVALAALGRCLAGARSLGRWRPGQEVQVHAFRAWPDGVERDVLVVWAEREVDWDARGTTRADWKLPAHVQVEEVVDYLGRSLGRSVPRDITSAPVFAILPAGQSATLPLEVPPRLAAWRSGDPSPVVLSMVLPRSLTVKVEDLPWSEGHAYRAPAGDLLRWRVEAYHFGSGPARGRLRVAAHPPGWEVAVEDPDLVLEPMDRVGRTGSLRVPAAGVPRDGWVVLEADCGAYGRAVVASRFVVGD